MGERERKLHLVHIEKRERERERERMVQVERPCSPSLLSISVGNSFTLGLQDLDDISLLNAEKAKDFFFFLMLKFLCGYWERSEKKPKKKNKNKNKKKQNKTKQNKNATILLAETIVQRISQHLKLFAIIFSVFSF